MRVLIRVFVVTAMLLHHSFASALPPDPAGVVKNLKGRVSIIREGQTFRAAPNTLLYEGDTIKTGFTGSAGLILGDETVVSMGRRTELVLKSYTFQPTERKASLIVRILHGTAAFISGRIAKFAPDAMRIETPQATVGVRGSHTLVEVD